MIDELKTDYKDDILATGQQGKRTFNIIGKNGEILFEDVHIEDTSRYLQVGDEYGGDIINEQNEAINKLSKGTGYVFDTYAEYQQAFAQGEIPVGSIVYIKEGSTDNTITALQVLYNNSTVKSALDELNGEIAQKLNISDKDNYDYSYNDTNMSLADHLKRLHNQLVAGNKEGRKWGIIWTSQGTYQVFVYSYWQWTTGFIVGIGDTTCYTFVTNGNDYTRINPSGILSSYATVTTDAWGNCSLPTSIIRPSTGFLLSVNIPNVFAEFSSNSTYDAYIIRVKKNDETMSNYANQTVTISFTYILSK